VDGVLSGTQRALLGVGALAVGGTIAWLATRGHDHADHEPAVPNSSRDLDGGPLPDPEPLSADGPADLAVAWWPQDIHFEQDGADATLRFQSTVANLGGEIAPIHDGDRLEYEVYRQDSKGVAGEVVGRGSMPLDRADVEPFPLQHVGHGVGGSLAEVGRTLQPITMLEPQHAAIVGSEHDVQSIAIKDATAGIYVLRQQIVRADGSTDPIHFDDTRLTEFILDGAGGILHTSSRYAD
jgi:hypothetical protein